MAFERILVTGGAGFIGSHTADFLIENGGEVLVADNLATGHLSNLEQHTDNPALRFEEMDVAYPAALSKAVASFQPQAIIHLAALVSVQESIHNPELNFERNVTATHRVIEAAREHSVPRIVFASSAAIFGDNPDLPLSETSQTHPLSPYGAAKLASECLLTGAAHAYGLGVIANRYFNVYGPRQDPASPYSGVMSIFFDRFKANQAVTVFGEGEQTRDFVFVRDVARINALAATATTANFECYNVCTGRSVSLLDLIAAFREQFPDAPAHQFAEARHGDIIHSLGNPDKASEHLGFRATTALDQGLKLYIEAS